MFRKNESLLLIDFDPNQGLMLKWKLPCNQNSVFFRHILFFDVDSDFDLTSFASQYFQRLKPGDMITFCCITEIGEFHLLKWREKSPITEIKVSRLRPSDSTQKDMALMLQKLDLSTEDFTEPIIYNFVTQKTSKSLTQTQTVIIKWMGSRERFCSNIFANAQTSIETTTGINYFDLEEFDGNDCQENWGFYKLYLSQISLLQIKITLECENGSFASKKQDEWRNVDFNKITRVISAPLTNYVLDTIQFLNEDSSPEANYTIKVMLEFTGLDNQKFNASKIVGIKAINEKIYQRTFTAREIEFASEVFPGFYSRKNPFQSKSMVWFKKTIEV